MRAYGLNLIDQHSNKMIIFTDASKIAGFGKTSAAFYVEDTEFGHAAKLRDGVSIYAAELVAIQMALEWVSSTQTSRRHNPLEFTELSAVHQATEINKLTHPTGRSSGVCKTSPPTDHTDVDSQPCRNQ